MAIWIQWYCGPSQELAQEGVKINHIEKFQELLKELFPFDAADLDFGIYRIMNKKRGAIERFIAEDSPKSRSQELSQGALAGIPRSAGQNGIDLRV